MNLAPGPHKITLVAISSKRAKTVDLDIRSGTSMPVHREFGGSPASASGKSRQLKVDTSSALGVLVEDGGFFAQTFGQSPSPLLRQEPGSLGPRYLVTYTMPGPTLATLEQDLYPYAAGGPVTYMRPGQPFWGDQQTVGGWYRGALQLKEMLVRAGLPKAAPGHRHFVSIVLAIVRRFLP